MPAQKKLIPQVRALLVERGQKALELARQTILRERIEFKPLQDALSYFILDWEDVLHPGLLSLCCEAMGGKRETTYLVGAALVLLAGGADIHDDVIDQSTIKDSKPTVFGKFGKDIAILAGDTLLFKGLYTLQEACEVLPTNQKKLIMETTERAFFKITGAEAKEASLRQKIDLAPEEYFDVIKEKVAVSEATAKIGALLGGATLDDSENLGKFGRTFGILFTLRDEFIDVFELDELKNRVENECLPLPVLFALGDSKKAEGIKRLLTLGQITEKEMKIIPDLVMGSKKTCELRREMRTMIKQERIRLAPLKHCRNQLMLLLRAMVEDL